MKWVEKWKVPRSTGEGTWTVSKADNGSWGCSCPRWKFHREECHHIQAVQVNPEAYTNGSAKPLPEIIPGNVEEVGIHGGYCLHPLIPLDGAGTEVLTTIVFDLLKLGYSFGCIKKRFHMIPSNWTAKAVKAHVQYHGRILCKPGKPPMNPSVYERVAV